MGDAYTRQLELAVRAIQQSRARIICLFALDMDVVAVGDEARRHGLMEPGLCGSRQTLKASSSDLACCTPRPSWAT